MQLTAALEVLRENPDIDTTHAIEQLASLETFAGTSAAEPAHRGGPRGRRLARPPVAVARRDDHAGDLSRRRRSPPRGGDVLPRGSPPGRRATRTRAVGRWRITTWRTCLMVDDPVAAADAAREAFDLVRPLRRPVRARDQRRQPRHRPRGDRPTGTMPTRHSPTTPTGTCSPTTSTSSRCACVVQRATRRCGRRRRAARRSERHACERGSPGHRHGGHRSSVRGDGAQRPWRRRCVGAASPSSRWSGPCPSPETTDGGHGRWPPGVPTSSAISPPRRSCSTSASGTSPANSHRCSAPKRC